MKARFLTHKFVSSKGWFAQIQALDPDKPNKPIEICDCGKKYIKTRNKQDRCHDCWNKMQDKIASTQRVTIVIEEIYISS